MMRPAFGGPVASDINVSNQDQSSSLPLQELRIYPNPVRDVLKFDTAFMQHVSNPEIVVVNGLGQDVLKVSGYTDYLDVSGLKSGLYVVKITDRNTGASFCKKFIRVQ